MCLHDTKILWVYQHQLKRASTQKKPTPREYQISIQNPTFMSQHQLGEPNHQVQDPTYRQKEICPTVPTIFKYFLQVHELSMLQHVGICSLIIINMRMFVPLLIATHGLPQTLPISLSLFMSQIFHCHCLYHRSIIVSSTCIKSSTI
jgi:hypothetical protein